MFRFDTAVPEQNSSEIFVVTYLHDELDRADEETEELENQVLLLLPTPLVLAPCLLEVSGSEGQGERRVCTSHADLAGDHPRTSSD